MDTYTLKVIDIRQETEDTITLCFKQPGLKKIKYTAGQYLTLIFRINGRRYIRPYSFSSAPMVDQALEVTVKRVNNGLISNHIHDVVKVGDSIEVIRPLGDFVYNAGDHSKKQLFLWGTGSGITPLISIAKQTLAENPDVRITLAYGNRNYESMIFSDLIHKLGLDYSERFTVCHFHTMLSVTEDPPFLVQGRITKESVFNLLKNVDGEQTLHFICGPSGLKESVRSALAELKISPSDIFSEDFELVKNPVDFEDISTQSVELKFEGKQYEIEVVKGKSILESALDAGIELPYSCQTGSCNLCKAELKNGNIKMVGLNQERVDLFNNEYLLCCSHPLTNNVSLEI